MKDFYFDEEPRYRKKGGKTVKKSDHKHQYELFTATIENSHNDFSYKTEVNVCKICKHFKYGRSLFFRTDDSYKNNPQITIRDGKILED